MKAIFYMLSFSVTLLIIRAGNLRAQTITQIQHGRVTTLRGLSVVNDSIAWVSGSNGYFAETLNGGKTWIWSRVKGYEKSDFRDVEAFSDTEALIMSSGTPALILKTIDGGRSWQVKYKNTDTAYFFDAMDFSGNKHGMVLGDPIKNNFLLMETTDGGETWSYFNNKPKALPGEACFAASGTCLAFKRPAIYIVTGGSNARLLSLTLKDPFWIYTSLPITHGQASTGGFSFATGNKNEVVIGGDYAHDKKTDSIAATYDAGVKSFILVKSNGLSGFQSCVEYLKNNTFLSTGTSGSNLTKDGGQIWRKIDNKSYNVCRKARHGNLVLLAGNNGAIGIFEQ